jgi:hypothetical protein
MPAAAAGEARAAAAPGSVAGAVRAGAVLSVPLRATVSSPLPFRLLSARLLPASDAAPQPQLRVLTQDVQLAAALALAASAPVAKQQRWLASTLVVLSGLPRDLQALSLSAAPAGTGAGASPAGPAPAAAVSSAVRPAWAGRVCTPGLTLMVPLTVESAAAASCASASLGALEVTGSECSDSGAPVAAAARGGAEPQPVVHSEMVPLPRLAVHAPPLTADIVAPTVGILGQPFALHLLLRNGSATVQGLQVNVDYPSIGLWLQQQAAAQRQAQADANTWLRPRTCRVRCTGRRCTAAADAWHLGSAAAFEPAGCRHSWPGATAAPVRCSRRAAPRCAGGPHAARLPAAAVRRQRRALVAVRGAQARLHPAALHHGAGVGPLCTGCGDWPDHCRGSCSRACRGSAGIPACCGCGCNGRVWSADRFLAAAARGTGLSWQRRAGCASPTRQPLCGSEQRHSPRKRG